MKNNKKNISVINILLLILSLVGYIILSLTENPAVNFTQYLMIIIPVYIVYLYFVLRILKTGISGVGNIFLVLVFGLIFRVLLISQDPWFSNDVYRYIWDGRVSAAGINPYQYPPDHIQLEHLQDEDIFPEINYPEIATVYPPVTQFFFWLNFHIGDSIVSWKIILIFLEISLTMILFKLAEFLKINKMRVMLFTLNPLVITETYMNGHFEILGLLFLWLAIYLFYIKREWLCILAAVPAVLVKFLPLLIYLPFMRPQFWKKILIIIGITALLIFPFALSGVIPMSGFFSYINRWSFNGAIFKVITSIIYLLPIKAINIGSFNLNDHLEMVYLNQEFYYKIFAAVILLFVIINQWRKSQSEFYPAGIRPLTAAFMITGTFLLLTPTLHPWYLLWIIPFLIFLPGWSWLIFTFLIQLSYQVIYNFQLTGIWQEQTWILLLEYTPFYGILIWEYMDRRRI